MKTPILLIAIFLISNIGFAQDGMYGDSNSKIDVEAIISSVAKELIEHNKKKALKLISQAKIPNGEIDTCIVFKSPGLAEYYLESHFPIAIFNHSTITEYSNLTWLELDRIKMTENTIQATFLVNYTDKEYTKYFYAFIDTETNSIKITNTRRGNPESQNSTPYYGMPHHMWH